MDQNGGTHSEKMTTRRKWQWNCEAGSHPCDILEDDSGPKMVQPLKGLELNGCGTVKLYHTSDVPEDYSGKRWQNLMSQRMKDKSGWRHQFENNDWTLTAVEL